MILNFNNFQFDCEQQLLLKNGKIYAFNEKPARLLTLLVLEPDKIHTKEAILEYVWPGRVITEQVIFQNISYLRTLFGSDAIKTFVKKGYQWQLPLKKSAILKQGVVTKVSQDEPVSPLESQKINLGEEKQHSLKENTATIREGIHNNASLQLKIAAAFIVFVMIISIIFFISKSDELPADNLVTFSMLQESSIIESIDNGLMKESKSNVSRTVKHVKIQSLFDSPYSTWTSLSNSDIDVLIATRRYQVEGGVVLRFSLQGKFRGWQGVIFSIDADKTVEQLNHLLELLVDSRFFSVKSEQLALAELSVLHQAKEENLLISHQLINRYHELGYVDRAMALVDLQLNVKTSDFDKALLHLKKSKVALKLGLWQSAEPHINKALTAFSRFNIPYLEAESRMQKVWFHVHQNNYPLARESVNIAIRKAREANEPLQEINAHLVQSSLAGKYNKPTLMQNELDLAQHLSSLHGLSDEHKIPVLNLLAALAILPEDKISFYQQIVDSPYSQQYQRRFYYSAERIRIDYIENKQWKQALSFTKPWLRRSFIALNKAHVYFAQNAWRNSIEASLTAYRLGQVDGVLEDALDAALLLLEINQKNGTNVNEIEYSDFIKQNANAGWLRNHKQQLEQVNLIKNVAS